MKKVSVTSFITLDEAAVIAGVCRESIYQTAIRLKRFPAQLIRSRNNGKSRARWMVNPDDIKAYYPGDVVVRDNDYPKKGDK